MNILVTGASGLVGSALVPFLTGKGHLVKRLIRTSNPGRENISWNPPTKGPDPALLEGIDAVVHLAGEAIACRWTDQKKKAIRNSRVEGTQVLVDSLLRMKNPVKVLVSASAIGYYGNHGEEVIRENSPSGNDFLADVCREWEKATEPARQKGIRVVNLRIGLILSKQGGALAKMLLPFKMGLGGNIANGQQYMSWITLDDLLGIIQFALSNDSLRGPVNAVTPKPVINEEFTKTLGRTLNRPTIFPMPAMAARLAFGEMADAILIGGVRVEPAKLVQSSYVFLYPDLENALRHLLHD